MRRERLSRIACAAAITTAALTCGPAFAQMVPAGPPPAPITPAVVNPALPATVCVPNGPTTGDSCPLQPTLPPPLTTAPPIVMKPLAPPAPSSPPAGLAMSTGGGIAAVGDDKVLSYFQRTVTPVDTAKAFGFVLMPKASVTAEEKKIQRQFCEIVLASMDFVTPDAVARKNLLVTYWPIVAERKAPEIEDAFAARDCDDLIAWYDHKLARSIAARAGVAGMSGPLLITWPSENAARVEDRDPLIVDFAKADYAHATKALQYWFGELRQDPKLWTSRMREGTIRAELADAINDTAGVVLAVLAGKWDSVSAVSDTP